MFNTDVVCQKIIATNCNYQSIKDGLVKFQHKACLINIENAINRIDLVENDIKYLVSTINNYNFPHNYTSEMFFINTFTNLYNGEYKKDLQDLFAKMSQCFVDGVTIPLIGHLKQTKECKNVFSVGTRHNWSKKNNKETINLNMSAFGAFPYYEKISLRILVEMIFILIRSVFNYKSTHTMYILCCDNLFCFLMTKTNAFNKQGFKVHLIKK